MISPDFRTIIAVDLSVACKKFVETNHGTELWTALQPSIAEIEAERKELQMANSYKCDVEQLKKFKNMFAKSYCNSMLMNKYFSFGPGPKQCNQKFTWLDSFSNDRVESYSLVFDALNAKYNYGVSLARIACFMSLEGDGIKYACKYMQQAAWVFDDLKTQVAQLKPGETSPDFTNETLSMLSNLMLAQAQYLFYKLATDKKQSAEVLSKVALQISVYFKEAHENSLMNRAIKRFQNGQFAGILEYHAKYFEASAWLVLGINRFQVAKDTGSKMGEAAGTLNHAHNLFMSMGSVIAAIPIDYKDNYSKKLANSEQMAQKAAQLCKDVFFEKVPEFKSIVMPDRKNFVKLDDSEKADLEKIPIMNETLRHIIPPEVRSMQSEIKTQVQNTIDQNFKS